MSTLRLVSWNVENLAPALGLGAARARRSVPTPRAHLLEIVSQLGSPDVLCLQEVRIRPGDAQHVATMHAALPEYDCHGSLCADPQNGKFRGGRAYGVATYVHKRLRAQALPRPSWDREGRVVAIALPHEALVVVNVYAVNGTDRPHFDHELGQYSGDRHAFKRRFQADLIPYVRSLGAEQRFVLMGDWNVSRSALDTWPRLRTELPHALARAMFNETLMPALDLVDAFRALHPEERAYTWFNRLVPAGALDAARVDFALVSRALMAKVQSARIFDEATQRFHSDHAPVEIRVECD